MKAFDGLPSFSTGVPCVLPASTEYSTHRSITTGHCLILRGKYQDSIEHLVFRCHRVAESLARIHCERNITAAGIRAVKAKHRDDERIVGTNTCLAWEAKVVFNAATRQSTRAPYVPPSLHLQHRHPRRWIGQTPPSPALRPLICAPCRADRLERDSLPSSSSSASS